MYYFEDLVVGTSFDLGSLTVTREELIAFARQFDPQPFHIDEEAARASLYGGLIASGWHTTALYMRLIVTGFLTQAHAMGSPGVEELRWKKPVFPGDTLRGEFRIIEKKPFRGKLGLVRGGNLLYNQANQIVLEFTGRMLFALRPEP